MSTHLNADNVRLSASLNAGIPGKSAYEIAVAHGYVGTEEEWLESLHALINGEYAVRIAAGENVEITLVDGVLTISATGGGGTSDHRELTNRDAANQHPMSAITGLEDALENLADAIPTELSDLTGDTGHRTVTDAEKSTWDAKQDTISDLDDIREGAAAGATALQSVSKSDVGLGNVDNTSDATKKSNFTGSIASGNTGFVTGGDVYTAIGSVEALLADLR